MRFFAPVRHLEHGFLARLVHLDYARAIAFVALAAVGEAAGVVRLHCDADHKSGEFAILIRSDLKGRGIGWALMKLMLEWARAENIETVRGDVMKANFEMAEMCRNLEFVPVAGQDDEATTFSIDVCGPDETSAAEAAA